MYYCGTLVCGICGHKLTTQRTIKVLKDGTKHVHCGYRCAGREKGLCTAKGMSHLKVENVFLEYLENIEELDEFDNVDLEPDNSEIEEQIESINKRLNQKNNKIKEIMRYFMNDQIDYKDYHEMKQTLEAEVSNLENELKKLSPKTNKEEKIDKKKIAKDILSHWQNLTNKERLQFLNEFVEKIVIVNRDDNRLNGKPEILDVKFYEI